MVAKTKYTVRDLVDAISPPWLGAYWGERFMGVIAMTGDLVLEGMVRALKAPWLRQSTSPPDALPLVGSERSMPRYDANDDDTYRARLLDAWNTWLFAGTVEGTGDQGMVGQYAAAGWLNVVIRNNFQWDFENPKDTADWSRFVVVLEQPNGLTTWTYGSGIAYGSEPDSPTYGSTATQGQITEVKSIARKWKTHHEINPYILVILSGEYYGDPDLVYGGAAVYGGESIKWPHMTAGTLLPPFTGGFDLGFGP